MLKNILLFVFLCSYPVVPRLMRRYYSWYSGFKCIHGEAYKENNCNVCICYKNTLVSCTFMKCSGEEYYLAKHCAVGKKWDVDCNQCECTAEYGTLCTVKECPDTDRPDDGSDESTTKEYIPTPPALNISTRCPECPACPCNCPDCDGTTPVPDETNEDCTYPPEDYDYYGDGDGGDIRPGNDTSSETDQPPDQPSEEKDNPEYTYPPDKYDYYGDKRW